MVLVRAVGRLNVNFGEQKLKDLFGDPSEAIQITKTFKIYNSKPLKYTIAQNHVVIQFTKTLKIYNRVV